MQALPTVFNKILGICYLQNERKEQLLQQWHTRVTESDAFLVEAEPEDDQETVLTALRTQIEEQEIVINPNEPCILVFFADLQAGLNPERLKGIEAGVRRALQMNIQLVLLFGDVGKLGLESPALQRENAGKLIAYNRESSFAPHKLCLVASPFLAGNATDCWKPVCVFLDVLSRQNTPGTLFPDTASDVVGYLRYGEFNESSYRALNAKNDELTALLEDGGGERFEELLKEHERKLRQMVLQRFPVHGSYQPLHPDMAIAPGGILGRSKRLQRFAVARDASEEALRMTGQQLEKDIACVFDEKIANAAETLKEIADAAALGLSLRANADEMARLLAAPADGEPKPQMLSLGYCEEGYGRDIESYLKKIVEHECSLQIQRFYEALKESIPTLTEGNFAERKLSLEKEQKKTRARLEKIYQPKKFCQKFAGTEELPEGEFSPASLRGNSRKFLLCTNVLEKTVNEGTAGTGTPTFCISNSAPDNAPLKGVQITFVKCPETETENVMCQLLP